MKKIILTLSCLTLSGCIGSYLVFQDEDPQPFETLHSVPEGYKFTPQQVHTQEELKLKSEHQKNLLKGKEERKKAQLLKE
ncbi:hypothetical protein IM40_02895 [Candidatus Paracaedimonas acanthamoebae]|nr:hypothetical protein IM40_02895 [Candidatus Paracaedimonas acanthamoebae]